MKKVLKSTILSAILALTGCATIMSDNSYPVDIKSNPSGAEFAIKNRAGQIVSRGVTPQTVTLKAGAGYFRGEKYQITFKKVGFQETIIDVDSRLDGWYLGNILFGGPIGLLIVDPATGAMFALPNESNVDLKPDSERSLQVMDINQLPKQQRSKLKRLK